MANLYIITGDDDFSRKRRAKEVATCWAQGEPEQQDSVEIISADSSDFKPDMVARSSMEAILTPSFFAERKLVWIRHHPNLQLLCTSNPTADNSNLIEVLKKLPEEVDVLIDGPGFDARPSNGKELKKISGKNLENFAVAKNNDRNYGEQRRNLLDQFCQTSGKKLAPDAAKYLIEVLSGDSGTLSNELEKLFCYVGDEPIITLSDCQAITSRTPEAVSWEFTQAIVDKNLKSALQLLGILTDKSDVGSIMRMIAAISGEFQKMIQTRLAMKQLNLRKVYYGCFNQIDPDLKARFPNNPLLKLHPFRAFKICESASKFSGAELAEKLTVIRDASRTLVSGGDQSLALEQLTITLCK